MRALLVAALATLSLAMTARAGEPEPGSYKVTTSATAAIDSVESIIKLEKKDGWKATIVATAPRVGEIDVVSTSVKDGQLRIVFKKPGGEFTFEGPAVDGKRIHGSYGDDRALRPAALVWTEDETIEANKTTIRKELPEPMKEAAALLASTGSLVAKIQQTKDAAPRAELIKEYNAKMKEASTEAAKLYRKALTDHADHPAAFDAAMNLLRAAGRDKSDAADVKAWAMLALKGAERNGPRFRTDLQMQIAEMVGSDPKLAELALDLARKAEAGLGDSASPSRMVRPLTVIVASLNHLKMPAEATVASAKLEKFETILDNEFLAKLPKLDAKKFEGRKADSKRVVLMELFTGAQCPPCVAADVAFDNLHHVYSNNELVLIQYHLHIPGPDPLTNADSVKRASYYGANSTPTTLFNGKKEAAGGGGMAAAGKKLNDYLGVINPILEEPAKAAVKVTATMSGTKVKIDGSVSDLDEPNEKVKLRFALIEDVVRYAGSNNLRFHHYVFRGMPGGTDGFALAEKSGQRQVTTDLNEVKGTLTQYLDAFAATRPFPKPQRPMELKNLKVVAYVQDDESKQVLQAAIVDVK